MNYPSDDSHQNRIWTEDEIETGRGLALLSYIPGLCFIALLHSSGNRYIKHHAKQGLILFFVEIGALLLRWNVIWNALLIICIGFAILGMAKAFSGRSFKIPILSDLFTGFRG